MKFNLFLCFSCLFHLLLCLVPLHLTIEQRGDTIIKEESSGSNGTSFQLVCNTNINKNIAHQISWLKDDRELNLDGVAYTKQALPADWKYAGSILEFKSVNQLSTYNYSGSYRCKIYIRYPDVGQGTAYASEPKVLKFDYFSKLLIYQIIDYYKS
jgi:hypothetical protein